MEIEHAPNSPDRRELNPILKLALELGPLAVFFFANSRAPAMTIGETVYEPIIVATGLFMIAMAASLIVSYALVRRVPIMPLVSGAVVLVFGSLTIFLNNDIFIKLKPTIVNLLFASVLLGGLAFGRSLLGYVFDEVFKLTDEGWRRLTFRWGLFFIVLAVINEIVWRNFSTDFWVAFKVWGVFPLTMVFTLSQMPLIQRFSLVDPFEKQSGE